MNYEERYNQALERAKKVHDGKLTISPNEVNDFNVYEYIFPELCESEDERIRKAIVKMISDIDGGFPFEKYGIIKKKALAWLEKQGELKLIDESESKFEVGDWITNGEYTWKVTDIKPLNYVLQSQNGDTVDDTISYVDEQFHLWTIQDAKDGDVLANGDVDIVLIFKCFAEPSYRQHIIAHIGLDASGDIQVTDGYWNLGFDCGKPATKEQRDLLFQKMKEAGYKWDAENKKLNKIEQESTWNEKIKGLNELETYILSLVPDRSLDAIKVDAKNIRYIIDKGQKPSCSEEDEEMIDAVIADIQFTQKAHNHEVNQVVYEREIDWLKSLKPQNHWKPSKEQMEALNKAKNSPANYYTTILELQSLYNDLKKL